MVDVTGSVTDVLTEDDLSLCDPAAASLEPALRQWLEHGRRAVTG